MSTPASPTAIGFNAAPLPQRLLAFAVIAAVEGLLASWLFHFRAAPEPWENPVTYAHGAAGVALLSIPLFFIVAWPRRGEIMHAQRLSAASYDWRLCLAANAALFTALMLVRYAFSTAVEMPSYLPLAAYSALLLATGASLVCIVAPPAFWRQLVTLAPVEIAVAMLGTGIAFGAGSLAQESWVPLSGATLVVSHWILTLYEQNVALDTAHRILGLGSFRVQVFGACSGYEGMGLIAAFLAIYLWVFRRELRFPNALLLFPAGMAVIWVLNALRIAVLVSIGAHVSPEIAVEGFHSQGGWMAFLIVTLGTIAASRRIAFFSAKPASSAASGGRAAAPAEMTDGTRRGADLALAFLAPFMALMAATILASAFVPHDQWLYALKVAAVGAALWWFRAAYVPILSGAAPLSIAVGVAVGALWIATDPGKGDESQLGVWLAGLPAGFAVLWLGLRSLGSIVFVPIAEELAFRGYLARVLIAARFESVAIGEFRWLAFLVSSLAFGLMHQRWLEAALAGAVYALLMYRTKRLADPIAAHMASNCAIMVWAVAAEQWSLL